VKYMKGYMYTLEVLIAISIVFISLVFLFRSSPSIPNTDTSLVKTQIYDLLDYRSDFVREKVSQNDEQAIEQMLKEFNDALSYKVKICSIGSCTAQLPDNVTITAMDYYVFADGNGKKLRIWVWGFDA